MKLEHNISEEEFEQIEAYLDHQLNADDLITFEKRLQNEAAFKAKVEDVKTLRLAVETQALKQQLHGFHEEMDLNHASEKRIDNSIRFLNWKYLAVAATLVMALTGFWFFNSNSNERLYAEYFTPDPGLPTTMSSTSNYEFYNSMVTYKQGNYSKAIKEWQEQLVKQPENDSLNYFIGVAKMADKKEADAIPYLKKVSELESNTFKNEAFFYLGLSYLKAKQREQALEAFKQSNLPESKILIQKLN